MSGRSIMLCQLCEVRPPNLATTWVSGVPSCEYCREEVIALAMWEKKEQDKKRITHNPDYPDSYI